jgi:hypothetical protein
MTISDRLINLSPQNGWTRNQDASDVMNLLAHVDIRFLGVVRKSPVRIDARQIYLLGQGDILGGSKLKPSKSKNLEEAVYEE